MTIMIWPLEVFFIILTSLIIMYLVRHYVFTLSILREAKVSNTENPPASSYEPTVSLLIPARNEDRVVARLLQRMTELTYPKNKIEVIVINDASSDQTGDIADDYAKRYNFIKVLHRTKDVGGKGKTAAMNAGFRCSNGEIVLCFDADYYPQKNIIEKLVGQFEDPKVGAVQGRVVVQNESRNTMTRLVTLERIGGYRVDMPARSNLRLVTQYGGTVGGLRRSLLERWGGWDEKILAEDTDLTFMVYCEGYKIPYVGDAECYEEAVDNLKAYWNQRYRWAKGHMQCCFKHTFRVIKSKKLGLVAKIDGLLLLNLYFMPLLVLLSIAIGVPLIFSGSSAIAEILWFSVPVSMYGFVGNFAPFFEVGIGTYLDGRKRIQWLIPLLIFTFPYNILICLKAFVDLIAAKLTRREQAVWVKTSHLGAGNYTGKKLG